MLLHPIINRLQQLNLHAMAKSLKDQQGQSNLDEVPFGDRLRLLVDLEITSRDTKRLQSRLHKAKLKHDACWEDIDYQTPH